MSSGRVVDAADRLDDGPADGDRGYEAAVHDVDVDHVGAGGLALADLVGEAAEVGGDDGGGDLDHGSTSLRRAPGFPEGGLDPARGGAAGDVAGGDGGAGVELEDVLLELRGESPVLLEREVGERLALGLGVADELGDGLVGVAEGDALADEVIGGVGGHEVAGVRCGLGALGVHLELREHRGEDGKGALHDADGLEEGDLVLLEVAVVGEREALESREDGHEVAVDAAGAAAGELGDVGVALLGHDAGAGRELVGEADEAELFARPEDDLLGEAGEVHHRGRGGGVEFDEEVAVANGVDAVAGDADEAEFLGYGLAIDRVRDTGERTGPKRQLFAGARHYTGEPDGIPVEHLEICEQVVSQEDRLGTLEVGVAWEDSTDVLLGEVKEDPLEDAEPGIDTADATVLDNGEAHVGGDLVVAGAGGVEAGAGVADLLAEAHLDVEVDVLEVLAPDELAGLDLGLDLLEALDDGVGVFGGDDALLAEHLRVGDGGFDVVRVERPVVADGGAVFEGEGVEGFGGGGLGALGARGGGAFGARHSAVHYIG